AEIHKVHSRLNVLKKRDVEGQGSFPFQELMDSSGSSETNKAFDAKRSPRVKRSPNRLLSKTTMNVKHLIEMPSKIVLVSSPPNLIMIAISKKSKAHHEYKSPYLASFGIRKYRIKNMDFPIISTT
ncbi:unnamed protein product, partial [Dovyalis caffra]